MKYYNVKLTKDEIITIITIIDMYLYDQETIEIDDIFKAEELRNILMKGIKNGRIKKNY